jgi:sulfate transport system permease protein
MADARHDGLRERPRGAGWAVAITSLSLLALLVLAPLAVVLVEAFAEGAGTFLDAITDEDTVSALGLTLLVVAIVVPFHTVFGVAAAWLQIGRASCRERVS